MGLIEGEFKLQAYMSRKLEGKLSYYSKILLTYCCLFALFSCSNEDGTSTQENSSKNTSNTQENLIDSKSDPAQISETPLPNIEPEQYFLEDVLLSFRSCESCHLNAPAFQTQTPGTDKIFVYEYVKDYLSTGTPDDNVLLNTSLGTNHPAGGDQCEGSKDNSPCKEIVILGKLLGAKSLLKPSFGKILSLNWKGEISGFAYDPDSPSDESIRVTFFDGDLDTGKELGETVANLDGEDGSREGSHAFKFMLPAEKIIEGKKISLHAYAEIDGTKELLANAPIEGTFYVPNSENFYNSSVAPKLQSCATGGCHGERSYLGALEILASPSPNETGSPVNNILYNKCNGIGHSGGNVCSGISSTLQSWWALEFQN